MLKFNTQNLGLVGFYLAIVILFSILSPVFRTPGNFHDLLTGFAHIGILAIGQTFPILLGGIDLSVGAVVGLVGMTTFDLMLIFGLPGYVAIPIGLLVGLLAGFISGALVVRFKLNPFIATLATMASFRGITYAISGRQLFPNLTVLAIQDPTYLAIDGNFGFVPVALIYLVILATLTLFLLRNTKLGVDLYAVGGNENAARLAGVNVERAKMFAYLVSGLCAAIAALVLTSRMNTSPEGLGLGFELAAIAAAVIGGVNLQGGSGNTLGPVLGALLIGTIYTGMNLLGVTQYAQPVVAGVILIGAVGYDQYVKTRRRKDLQKQQLRQSLREMETAAEP
jgi:ribose/xylose/arabinose/galactoside ABC-type transport system permease subunit